MFNYNNFKLYIKRSQVIYFKILYRWDDTLKLSNWA